MTADDTRHWTSQGVALKRYTRSLVPRGGARTFWFGERRLSALLSLELELFVDGSALARLRAPGDDEYSILVAEGRTMEECDAQLEQLGLQLRTRSPQ